MTQIATWLGSGVVIPRLAAPTRKLAIQALAHALARAAGLPADTVFDAVMTRERQAPTGLCFGVALPHARVAGVNAPICALARLESPVDFNALDGVPADLVVMLLTPARDGALHLKALAALARQLRRAEFRDSLRAARGQEGLLAAFEALHVAA
jgi:nitrogen PTS system EIIA component